MVQVRPGVVFRIGSFLFRDLSASGLVTLNDYLFWLYKRDCVGHAISTVRVATIFRSVSSPTK